MLRKNHDFLKSYLEYVSDNTVILGYKIKNHANRTKRENIISYLDYECKKQNSHVVKLTMSKKALAERFGVQRTSLSRELAKMRDDGLIEFDFDSITILAT